MKAIFHKTFSLTMALLLLLSTISWKVEKHYCMGRLIDVALFVDAESCGMDMFLSFEDEGLKEAKKSCCDDEVILVDGQDNLKITQNDLEIENHSYTITSYCFEVFNDIYEKQIPKELYPPPLLIEDIQLLHEVFLI